MMAPFTRHEYPSDASVWTSSDFSHVAALSVDFRIVRWLLLVFEAGRLVMDGPKAEVLDKLRGGGEGAR